MGRGYHLNKYIDRRMAKYVYPKIKAPVFTVYDKNGNKKQNILGVSTKVHIKLQKKNIPKSKKNHIKSPNKSLPKSEMVQKAENEKQKLSKSQRRKNRKKMYRNKDQNHSVNTNEVTAELENKSEPKSVQLSKAQKRKLRMKKNKNQNKEEQKSMSVEL